MYHVQSLTNGGGAQANKGGLKPNMAMETPSQKVSFKNIAFKEQRKVSTR